MANRMKRGPPKFKDKEPLRKKPKLNTLFDEKDVWKLSKNAEISASAALTKDEKRIEIGKRILEAARDSIEDAKHSDSDEDDDIVNEDDNDDDDNDVIDGEQLVHDKLLSHIGEKEGRFFHRFGDKLRDYFSSTPPTAINVGIRVIRGHRLAVTCMAMDPTGRDRYVITGSKDGSVIKWDLRSGRRVKKVWHAWPINNRNAVHGKTGKKLKWGGLRYHIWKKVRPRPVLAVAISPDEKWLVTGGEDCLIRVWHAQTMRFHSTFRGGHTRQVTGLAFAREDDTSQQQQQQYNNTLFSIGADRQIRVYDMNEIGFAEPLYGHTQGICGIDATIQDQCITVSEDKTIRYWKLRTQSQLIFSHAHREAIDACCLLSPGRFVTGSQDGSMALWAVTKKHPLHQQHDVHVSADPTQPKQQQKNRRVRRHWICSLGARHNSDVFASGSSDGVLKFWMAKGNSVTHLRSVCIPKGAFVNVIKFTSDGRTVVCGLGDEHRLGRWHHENGAKNGIAIIRLPIGCSMEEDGEREKKEEEKEKEKESVKFETAETWDKWHAKERGEYVSDAEDVDGVNADATGNVSQSKDEGLTQENAVMDEWNSFFGNVFG